MGPCRAGLPSFGYWAAAALRGAAGWVPSGGFGGWCLALATAGSGFRLMGLVCGVLWVGCGSVARAALLCMVFRCTSMQRSVYW